MRDRLTDAPPRDERGAADVGRCARLELVFGLRRGRTVLLHAYAEPPLRVGRCFETGCGLHLILAASAPGYFGGDCIEQHVTVQSGARVRLTSQSALQIHPSMDGAPASVIARYEVAPAAELACVWHPTIPFADAVLHQQIAIDVASGGRLSWSDAMTSGREGCGERWRFRSIDHELRVTHTSRLVYLERYRVAPSAMAPAQAWIAAGCHCFGTTLRVGPDATSETAETVHRDLAGLPGVVASADIPEADVLLVKVAADTSVGFHRARQRVAQLLGNEVWMR
jgi:urease accessory protein